MNAKMNAQHTKCLFSSGKE